MNESQLSVQEAYCNFIRSDILIDSTITQLVPLLSIPYRQGYRPTVDVLRLLETSPGCASDHDEVEQGMNLKTTVTKREFTINFIYQRIHNLELPRHAQIWLTFDSLFLLDCFPKLSKTVRVIS